MIGSLEFAMKVARLPLCRRARHRCLTHDERQSGQKVRPQIQPPGGFRRQYILPKVHRQGRRSRVNDGEALSDGGVSAAAWGRKPPWQVSTSRICSGDRPSSCQTAWTAKMRAASAALLPIATA